MIFKGKLKIQTNCDNAHIGYLRIYCVQVGMHTHEYVTFIEKTAWQTQNGGVCPMVTQHNSLIFPGSIFHVLIDVMKTSNQ